MSYITVNQLVVRRACEMWLDARKKRIMDLQEPSIQKVMKGSWPLYRTKTRDEAIKYLQLDIFNDYSMCSLNGAYDASVVEQLYDVSTVSTHNDVINLSIEHANILKKYLPIS